MLFSIEVGNMKPCPVLPTREERGPRFSERRSGLVLLFILSLVPIPARGQDCRNSGAELSAKASLAILQTASGSSVVHLENSQSGDMRINLTAGTFVNQTTGGIVSGAVAFTAGDGSGTPPKNLPRGASVDVLATITNESAVGLSVTNLFNAGKCVGQLKAVRYDAPFNFTVEGDGSASSTLRVVDGQDVPINLKNNDDLTYPITPSLYLDGEEIAATPATLTVGPNTPVLVRFKTSQKWFDWGTWFRPKAGALRVVVRPTRSAFGDMAGDRALASRFVAVNAQLARLSATCTELVSSGVVFVVLLLGGLASLATNSLLPNVLKKLSYKKKLQALADATSGVSVKVDSRLRVLLRVERNRLLKLLASSSLFSTDPADVFQQVDTGLSALGKRVTIAQRLDELRNQFDLRSLSCPPSVSDKVDECLQQAADQLRTISVTDKIVDNANLALDSAEQTLNTLAETDVLAKGIALRHTQLLARVATFPKDTLTPFKHALPGIFPVLGATYDDAHPVLPTNFMQIDDSIARVNVALDSIYVYATTKDPGIQGRLKARNDQLLQLLGTRDWRTLRAARDLVEQMRQNIYPEDLIEALRAKKASITIDQQVARPYSPLELCICFDVYVYNHTKALEQLRCVWNFDDGLAEKGWTVCHFYQEPAEKTITAEIPLSIPTAAEGSPDRVQFSTKLAVRQATSSFSKQYWLAGGLRFAIAFFLALVGLVGGARDQLAKLDVLPALIAVFLLGFGADTIKNIFAQKNGQPSPSAAK
jgi:hypothetical protein